MRTWESFIGKGRVSQIVAAIESFTRERGDYPLVKVLKQNRTTAELEITDILMGPLTDGKLMTTIKTLARIVISSRPDGKCDLQISDDEIVGYYDRKEFRDYFASESIAVPKGSEETDKDKRYERFKNDLIQGLLQRGVIEQTVISESAISSPELSMGKAVSRNQSGGFTATRVIVHGDINQITHTGQPEKKKNVVVRILLIVSSIVAFFAAVAKILEYFKILPF